MRSRVWSENALNFASVSLQLARGMSEVLLLEESSPGRPLVAILRQRQEPAATVRCPGIEWAITTQPRGWLARRHQCRRDQRTGRTGSCRQRRRKVSLVLLDRPDEHAGDVGYTGEQ